MSVIEKSIIKPGFYNSICDVDGIKVGNAADDEYCTGVTVVCPDSSAVTGVDVRGGAPGTRDTEALNPSNSLNAIDAVVLSGGSVFGLEAASEVTRWLSSKGRGLDVYDTKLPIVSSAVIFDFPIGKQRDWTNISPFTVLAKKACEALSKKVDIGNVGAGMGATAGHLKGGLGTASYVTSEGWQIGAIAIVNSFGEVLIPGTRNFWAGNIEYGSEFGGLGSAKISSEMIDYKVSSSILANTTLCVVATNLQLNKSQAQRVAIISQDGLARAIRPVHTSFDGDIVFAMSTGRLSLPKPVNVSITRIGNLAADCVSRAIARGVYSAKSIGNFGSYS